MQEFWESHWMNFHKRKQKKDGLNYKDLKIRAWVIRIPGAYIGLDEVQNIGFQTVIQAYDEEEAVKLASHTRQWEELSFPVTCFQVFPKHPTVTKL